MRMASDDILGGEWAMRRAIAIAHANIERRALAANGLDGRRGEDVFVRAIREDPARLRPDIAWREAELDTIGVNRVRLARAVLTDVKAHA